MLRRRFPEIVLLWSAVSFFVLLLELLLTNHTEELQLVGAIAALAGTIAALAGLGAPTLRLAALVLLSLVALAGAAGTLVHWREGGEEKAEYAYEYDEDEAYEEGEGAPPPLAPLGLSGTALLAGLAILARDGRPTPPSRG